MKAAKATKGAKPARVVTALVNGQVVGTVPETSTIGAAALQIGKEAGLRAFSIKVDGGKVAQPDANKTLVGRKTIEVYAKDSRG